MNCCWGKLFFQINLHRMFHTTCFHWLLFFCNIWGVHIFEWLPNYFTLCIQFSLQFILHSVLSVITLPPVLSVLFVLFAWQTVYKVLPEPLDIRYDEENLFIGHHNNLIMLFSRPRQSHGLLCKQFLDWLSQILRNYLPKLPMKCPPV